MADEAKIKRLAEIQDEIEKLTQEGMSIADEQGVIFSLSRCSFTNNYGSGGLEYYPNGETPYVDDYGDSPTTMWGDPVDGNWMSSNSWGC